MANMTFKASLLPNTDLGYSLGSEDKRWNIYGKFAHTPDNTTTFLRGDNTFSNTLTGNIYTKGYYLNQANANSTQANHAAIYIWGDNAIFAYRDSSNAYLGEAFRYNITNGATTFQHDVGIPVGSLRVGTEGSTSAQRLMSVASGAGALALFADASTTGSRGLWANAHGTGAGKSIINIDTNNNATFAGNADTASKWKIARTLTIGSTGKSVDGSANVSWSLNEIGATVSNAWTAGTTAGPTIKTTVNGVTGTAVAIPSASASASGIVTTGAQTFAGLKIFKNDNGAIMTSKVGVTRGTVPSANQYSGLYFLDSTGQHAHSGGGRIAIVESYYTTDGTTCLSLATYPNTVGSTATNYIGIYSTQSGTCSYAVKDPAAFRTALGLGARATDNTAYLPLTGGAMTGAIQWNGRGQNSIYNGPNDQASGVGGTLNNLVISSWYGISFTTNCAGTYQGKNAVSINTRTGNVYANSFNGILNSNANSIGSSWVDSRDKAAVNIDASDSSSSVAYSLCRIKFPSKTFAICSERNNPQFGIYGWNNSRTENGYDWAFYLANNGYFYANTRIYGAVWNDYAEKRNIPEAQETDWKDEECVAHPYAGRCVRENGDDTMSFSTERLQKGCKIISDTFGYCVGETDDCKTPIAVSGRALVYLLEDRETAKEHIGDFVCSGPNGTVSIMTTEEYFKCPQAVVGTISAVPDYEEWGTGHVKVDGRIWIYVR